MGLEELFTTTSIIELNAIKNINVLTIIDIFFKNNPSFYTSLVTLSFFHLRILERKVLNGATELI